MAAESPVVTRRYVRDGEPGVLANGQINTLIPLKVVLHHDLLPSYRTRPPALFCVIFEYSRTLVGKKYPLSYNLL